MKLEKNPISKMVATLAKMSMEARNDFIGNLSDNEIVGVLYNWEWWARPEQLIPPGDWTFWLIKAGRGFGKMLDINTDIKVVNGWKKLKDIKNGDKLFDNDGNICKVLKAHKIQKEEAYKLYFDTGEEIICCENHLWYTISKLEDKQIRRGKSIKGSIKTTDEITKTIKYRIRETNHRIPIAKPLKLSKAKLLIDPYVFGVWLGDGDSNDFTITTRDKEILDYIRNKFIVKKPFGENLDRYSISNGVSPKRNKVGQFIANKSLHSLLKKLNVYKNKHIPNIYKNSSAEQRLELLKGLMDSDGYCEKNGWNEIVTTNKNIAKDIFELISSLGIKTRIYKGKATIGNKVYGIKYRIFFKTDIAVYKLKRKLKRQLEATKNQLSRHKNRFIVKAEKLEKVKMRCLTVDSPDGLFLVTKSLIATHNTRTGAEWIRRQEELGFNRIGLIAPTAADCRDIMVEGESLDINIEIPTPTGWKTLKDINVGDSVFSCDGTITKVIAISPIWQKRPCYKIEMDCAASIIADEKHLWITSSRSERTPQRKYRVQSIKTTKEILDTLYRRYDMPEHEILMHLPLQTKDIILPVPPYTLGAWLGDGDTRGHGTFTCKTEDREIIENIKNDGFLVNKHKGYCEWGILKFGILLKQFNLKNNKHIPNIYMRAGLNQRLSLLQGLLDTDGFVSKRGQCSFDNTNKKLVENVRELLLTIGIKPGNIDVKYKLNYKPIYRIRFTLSKGQPIPFRFQRKKDLCIEAVRSRGRLIRKIEKAKSVPVKCIQVEHLSGTYLAGRDMVITHNSGILATAPPWNRPLYEPSKRRLTWPSGIMATTYSAEEPDRLRGPQHEKVWADEIGHWKYPEAWDMAKLGLRLGSNPQAIITTTPKPVRIVRELLSDKDCVVTGGSTYDNIVNLASAFYKTIVSKYEGTRLGRQEIHAELLDDTPGALWTREMIDKLRVKEAPELARIVIAIDPAVTSGEGSAETGIIAGGIGVDGHGYVLQDITCRMRPHMWAKRAVNGYHFWKADRVIGEVNNGGDLVEAIIRTVDPDIPYQKVWASRGKRTRAEPISALYEQGRIHHVGTFQDLEDQQCSFLPEGTDVSPDRVDALVWCFTFLMLEATTFRIARA